MTDNYGRSLEYRIDLAVQCLRIQFGLSQQQYAKRIRRPRTYITKIERRKRDPTIQTVNLLAAGFGLSPRRFMELATVKA